MGTRGSITFVSGGKEKTVYNHFDSYPSGVGAEVLGEVRLRVDNGTVEGLKAQIANLKEVNENTPITPAHVEALKEFTDLHVGNGTGDPDLWYKLLRGTQGDVAAILKCGYFESADDFPSDSLFCEWGYVIDADEEKFEVYRGFQTEPHDEGRFAGRVVIEGHRSGQYYPIRLVGSFDFDDLPTAEEFTDMEGLFRIRGNGGLVPSLREEITVRDELKPFVDHLLEKIDEETDIDDAKSTLDRYDTGEAADYVDESVPEDEADEWAEAALSEFGFEGCGESMSGIRQMARYAYNKAKVHEAEKLIVETLDELVG